MSELLELYARTNNSDLRNKIEMALLQSAQTEIDADGTAKAYALTLLNQATAQVEAQRVLRYLVAKYEDAADPSPEQIETAVAGVFAKLAGG